MSQLLDVLSLSTGGAESARDAEEAEAEVGEITRAGCLVEPVCERKMDSGEDSGDDSGVTEHEAEVRAAVESDEGGSGSGAGVKAVGDGLLVRRSERTRWVQVRVCSHCVSRLRLVSDASKAGIPASLLPASSPLPSPSAVPPPRPLLSISSPSRRSAPLDVDLDSGIGADSDSSSLNSSTTKAMSGRMFGSAAQQRATSCLSEAVMCLNNGLLSSSYKGGRSSP